ncbi:hypothetical protein MMC30_000921 [Trapelia coarctata]|nr:hypothetical protein [Trapelia coarctata]
MATPNQNQNQRITPARVTQLLSQLPQAPPPYSPSTPTNPTPTLTTSTSLTKTKIPSTHHRPSINIKVDASVTVQGNLNHCYLPATIDTQHLSSIVALTLKQLPEVTAEDINVDVKNTYTVTGDKNFVAAGGTPVGLARLAHSARGAGTAALPGNGKKNEGNGEKTAVNGGEKGEAGTKRKADEESADVPEAKKRDEGSDERAEA